MVKITGNWYLRIVGVAKAYDLILTPVFGISNQPVFASQGIFLVWSKTKFILCCFISALEELMKVMKINTVKKSKHFFMLTPYKLIVYFMPFFIWLRYLLNIVVACLDFPNGLPN